MQAFRCTSVSPPDPRKCASRCCATGGSTTHASWQCPRRSLRFLGDEGRGLFLLVFALARFDAGQAPELAMDAPDAFDLPLGREAFVEAVDAETFGRLAPRGQLS